MEGDFLEKVSPKLRRNRLKEIILSLQEEVSREEQTFKQIIFIQRYLKLHGEKLSQSTISRDITALGGHRESDGWIVFKNQDMLYQKRRDLSSLILNANSKVVKDLFDSYYIQVTPKYTELISNELIQYFKQEHIQLYCFNGSDGLIQLKFHSTHKDKIVTIIEKHLLKKES